MHFNACLIHALEPSSRRCFDRKEAASYVGVSPPTFDRLVDEGSMPQPIQFFGRKVWDREALDRTIDIRSGIDRTAGAYAKASAADPLDAWRSKRAS